VHAEIDRLKELALEWSRLEQVVAVLQWDQETYLPEGAVEGRAEQAALLQGLVHDRITAPEVGELLARLGGTETDPPPAGDLDPTQAAIAREAWRSLLGQGSPGFSL